MVQVIREESDEEVWQKPLREAIVNIGNSWAGATVRKQNHAAEYAKNAANRAHETYMNQLRINSSEKVSSNNLKAQQARNKTLDAQNEKSFALQESKFNHTEKLYNYQKNLDQIDVNATGAIIELADRQAEFRMSKTGLIEPVPIDKAYLKKAMATIYKSAAVGNSYRTELKGNKERQNVIAGRLQMLQSLRTTHGDGIISKMINGGEAFDAFKIAELSGQKGTEGYAKLQSLSRIVQDDAQWQSILKSYKVTAASGSGVDGYKGKQLEKFTEHGKFLVQIGGDETTTPFNIANNRQIGLVDLWGKQTKTFNRLGSSDRTDLKSVLGAVNNLEFSIDSNAQRGLLQIGSAFSNFAQKHRVVFSNPEGITNSILGRVTKVAQNGPDKIPTEEIDKSIHRLIFEEGDIQNKAKEAKNLMKEFISGANLFQANRPGIVSAINGDKRDLKGLKAEITDYDKVVEADADTRREAEDTPLIGKVRKQGIIDSIFGDKQAYANSDMQDTKSATIQDMVKEDGLADQRVGGGLGWLTKSGTVSELKGNATINMKDVNIRDANTIMFAGRLNTPEERWYNMKFKEMRKHAAGRYAGQEENRTGKRLGAFYASNQKMAEIQMLSNATVVKQLFHPDGRPKNWHSGVMVDRAGSTPLDYDTIMNSDITPEVRKQFELIFKYLALDKSEKDNLYGETGDYDIGDRLANLAKATGYDYDVSTKKTSKRDGEYSFNINNEDHAQYGIML